MKDDTRPKKTFPFADAQLAVDIDAVLDQLSRLCDRARGNSRHETVRVRLADALSGVTDALQAALAVEKP